MVAGSGDIYRVTESGLQMEIDPHQPPKAASTPADFLKDVR
jgi:hypothetical protein